MQYPKTENLYARDMETFSVGPENGFRVPEIGLISKWLVLEKVDGMNMRVIWHPYGVNDDVSEPELRIAGRTDRAQIPGDLLSKMEAYFTNEALFDAFDFERPVVDEQGFLDVPDGLMEYAYKHEVVLFGEGYGAGIQQGGHYRPDKDFILFDVVVNGTWLSWANVKDVAAKLGIETVPALAEGVDLETAKTFVASSQLTEGPVEGIIGRTDPYLFTGRGQRVAFKYKGRDLSAEDLLAVSA